MPARVGAVSGRLQRRAAQLSDTSWDWQDLAKCRDEPSDLFFGPEREPAAVRRARERDATRICRRCPVLKECRMHALSVPELYGVWGGTTEEERLRARRATTTPAA